MFYVYWQKLFLDWHKIPSPLGPGIDDTEHLGPPRFGEQFRCQLRADCRDRYRTSCCRSSRQKKGKRKEPAAPDRGRKLKPALPGGIFTKTQGAPPTGLLLLQGQVGPAALHAVTQGHPQVGLLLERHSLPALFDVGQGRVGERLARHGPGRSQSGGLRQGIAS